MIKNKDYEKMVATRENTLKEVRNKLNQNETNIIKENGKNFLKHQKLIDMDQLAVIMSKVLDFKYASEDMYNPKMLNLIVKLFIML